MGQRTSLRAAAVVIGTLVLSACSGGSGSASTQAAGDGVVQEFAPSDRIELTSFSGETLTGTTFDSADALGTVLVINVWGSWCVPCRGEAPDLKRAARDLADDGVRFVGIDVRDNNASALAFERQYGITYPSINTETSAAAMLAIGAAAPSNAVPATVILDAQGRVAARVVGATTYSTLMALVEPVVAESTENQAPSS